jgi:two-component system cell cycle sensor histidine kinase/response regulator CckA
MSVDRGHSILIVEDERIVAKDMQLMLRDLGYDAYAIASSADEAIAYASERCPDLVLMDIRIKGPRDGIDTAEILRSRFGVPIVYLTAHADEGTIQRAKATEPYGYLVKPVRHGELHGAIEVSIYKHKIDKRIQLRERWFSTTLRSIGDAVVTVDIGGLVTFVNPVAEELIGAKAQDLIGKSAETIMRLLDRQSPGIEMSSLETALRLKQPVGFEDGRPVKLASGEERVVSNSAAPVIDEGNLLGAVMVLRDVTETKRLQKQLELADRLNSLGTMAAGAAHELRNPLSIVVTNAGFVAEELRRHRHELERLGSTLNIGRRLVQIDEALADLQSAANRMGRIVADLRTFSRPVEQSSGVADLFRCVERSVRATSQDFQNRAQVRTHFDPMPPVIAEEARVEQVLVNLLVNASHAIEPGHAERNEVRVVAGTNEHGWAFIDVRDTGKGIAPAVMGKIFDPFFTTKPVGVGTGLGLSICRGIITSLGGHLKVESELGAGTTCHVSLPPAPAERLKLEPRTELASRERGRGRILAIDDEEMLLRAITRVLEDDGHSVVGCKRAQDALAMIEGGAQFEVILCDLMMPQMTGTEFYEALLAMRPDLASRVVFVTGGASSAKVQAFLDAVPNPQITKPYKAESLRESVQHSLAKLSLTGTQAKKSA